MKFMTLLLSFCLVLFLSSTAEAAGDHEHPIPTFFWRKHKNGSLVDRGSPAYDAEIRGIPIISKILRNDAETVKLQAWPDTIKNGEKITLLWAHLANHQPRDWVAYYCPYYDDDGHYLDWFYLKDIGGGVDRSYGHAQMHIFNMRGPCIFKLFRQVWKDPNHYYYQLAATSNLVKFENGDNIAPTQGHIALTNDPTQMRVMWVSAEVPTPPLVRYGTTKDMTLKEYAHLTHTYTKDSMCQGRAISGYFWHPGTTYDFLLKNLKPNTLYYYSYGTEEFMSETKNFTTPLPKGDPTPFQFIVYGDMGVFPYPNSYQTAHLVRREVAERNNKFVFHIGDISYARGIAYIWDQWGWLIEPYATLVPYMVGIGNHEYDYTAGGLGKDPSKIKTDHGWKPKWFNGWTDSHGECGVPMHNRYHMPDNGNGVFWYSYDYGMVHMIMISTEHDYSPGSDQYVWLENDLKSVDRKLTPWVFIGGHRPMYNSQIFPSDYVVAEHMQELFEDLLYKYKVDMAFWAHYHSYERTCKLYRNDCVEDGVTHITVGNAGAYLNYEKFYRKDWSLVRLTDYGFGRVRVANASALLFELVTNRHNEVKDHVWLFK